MISIQARAEAERIAADRSGDDDVQWLVDVIAQRLCPSTHPEKPEIRCSYYAYHARLGLRHEGADSKGAPWGWAVSDG